VSPSIGPSEAKMQPAQVVVAPGSENENGGEDEQDQRRRGAGNYCRWSLF